MTRTNSWTSRRRRRRRRPSQARTLARWTAFCGNILNRRGGPRSPQAGLPTPLTPGPLRSVSQVPSDPAPLERVPSARYPPPPSLRPGLRPSEVVPPAAWPHEAPRPWWTRRLARLRGTPDSPAARRPRTPPRGLPSSPPVSSSPLTDRGLGSLSLRPSLAGNGAILELDGREGQR